MNFLRQLFKTKNNKLPQQQEDHIDYAMLSSMLQLGADSRPLEISEPQTLAKERLEGGARDIGSAQGRRMFNQHKAHLQNQWVNPLQSINSGFGNAQLSYYNYQNVNYYECYSLAQDPLFNRIFELLSNTPFANGGELISDFSTEENSDIEAMANKYHLIDIMRKGLRSAYVSGGCLIYLDFGLEPEELTEPLDLNTIDLERFKGFRHIDPINIVAVDVNTVNPAAADYMSPKVWYVVGLGTVHYSHFLKFEENIPELILRPLCMYFGMPLTQLIKQDIANSNLASQGLANLINRLRYVYLKVSDATLGNTTKLRSKLSFMSMSQDNFTVCPIKLEEEVSQLTTSVTGMADTVEFFFEIVGAKTGITKSILLSQGASGLSGTLQGERANWHDHVRADQELVKANLLTMYGIIAGKVLGTSFISFKDYVYNPLERSSEKEIAEDLRSYAEVAKSLVELGAKQEQVLEWLKKFKSFNIDNLEFDTDVAGMNEFDMNGAESDTEEDN